MKIEIIGKQDIKLDPQDTAFCEQGTVLFNDRKKMWDQCRIGDHDSFAKESTAFRPTDVEDIAESCEIF